MHLFFVYDTSYCKADEDDPKDAVLYFYPSETCETQRYALCCQLVGVAQFLKLTFTSPSVITLNKGKFAMCKHQNYLLVLGANSNTNSNTLKKRLHRLYGIFCFYHLDINHVWKTSSEDRLIFLEKMNAIWNQCLLVFQCFGSMAHLSFDALPVATPQQNSSKIYSKAHSLLQMCQLNSGVIAGAVFCQKWLLSSQFTPDLTNYLTLLHSCDTSSMCNVAVDYSLPPGVQLKYIYLTQREIEDVLKYNHKNVGSQFRIREYKKQVTSSSNSGTVSSGSEGDVDSGNSSENIQPSDKTSVQPINHRTLNIPKLSKFETTDYFDSSLVIGRDFVSHCYSEFSDSSKDTLHALLLEKNKFITLEQLYLHKYAYSFSNQMNLLCKHHSICSTSSVIPSKCHLLSKSSSDVEFKCYLCENPPAFFKYTKLKYPCKFKRWNSDTDIADFQQRENKKAMFAFVSAKLCFLYHMNKHLPFCLTNKNSDCKLQILKCRCAKEIQSKGLATDKSMKRTRTTSLHQGNQDIPKENNKKRHLLTAQKVCLNSPFHHHNGSYMCERSALCNSSVPAKDVERQKFVLYVQRYGNCLLILLLSNDFNNKLLNHLWTCGFSILGDLEFDTKKQLKPSVTENIEGFQMYLYNLHQKILAGKPKPVSCMSDDKVCIDPILQSINEEFHSNLALHSVCVMESTKSTCGYNTTEHQIFYQQSEKNSRKPTSFSHIYDRASRKIEKYFGISVSEF